MKKILCLIFILALISSAPVIALAGENPSKADIESYSTYSNSDKEIMTNNTEGMQITADDIARMEKANQKVLLYMEQVLALRSSGGKTLSTPLYRQPDEFTCGPTCMQMILKYVTGVKYNIGGDLDKVGSSPTTDALAAMMNRKIGTDIYTYTYVSNINTFLGHVYYSIDNSRPLIFQIKPSSALKNYETYTGTMGGHYIVGRGYYWAQSGSSAVSTISYSDPHYSTPYGNYTDDAADVYAVVKNRTGYIVNAI